jgi:hypothetical protein
MVFRDKDKDLFQYNKKKHCDFSTAVLWIKCNKVYYLTTTLNIRSKLFTFGNASELSLRHNLEHSF